MNESIAVRTVSGTSVGRFPFAGGRISSPVIVMGASLFIALCAQIALPLPHTPVPVTGQTFAVLLVGALLGARRGASAAALYLVAGAAGLPFFAPFGAHTAGYLIGFVPAAWLAGFLAERGWDRNPETALPAMLAASAVIHVFGLAWLSFFVPADSLLALGLYPFIPGDIAKCCLAAALLPGAWKLLGNRGGERQRTVPAGLEK